MASEAADGLDCSLAKDGGFPSGFFFLKISADSAHRARATLASMDRQTRRGCQAAAKLRYMRLFDLPVREGRTYEALAVLGLLKKGELSVLAPSFRQSGPLKPGMRRRRRGGKGQGDAAEAAWGGGPRGCGGGGV
jgi:hypothetical protein